jgi:dihydrofolate synthase/folylpolyglutamate synthase
MNYASALEYLDSFINYERNLHQVSPKSFSLERVRKLLHALGDPQSGLDIIHVAGTKGKGSTCAFISSILQHAGYRTGLYTSPHIHDIRERIRVLDLSQEGPFSIGDAGGIYPDMIEESTLASLVHDCKNAIEQRRNDPSLGKITFFEVLTALALVYFKQQKTDAVVLETGLGGRLDATNAAASLIAAITPISLEHTHLLGDTLELITHEKKMIIKSKDQRVVLAPQENIVAQLLQKHCASLGISPVIVGRDVVYKPVSLHKDRQVFDLDGKHRYKALEIPLLGQHQLVNASVALAVIEAWQESGRPVSSQGITEGLKHTFWPLRFERLGPQGNIILDGAHTASSSHALAEAVLSSFPGRKVTMIVGFTQGKDIPNMCRQFDRIAGKVIATQSRHPRALTPSADLIRTGFPHKPFELTQNVEEAVALGKKDLRHDEILLICGSLYLVSEARKLCIN